MLEFDWENSIGYWICTTSHGMRRALGARLAAEGITLRQWEVLAWLAIKGDASQAELADCLGIEPHTLAGVVRRMERDGWLERTSCTSDRRRNKIHPTEKVQVIWGRAVECCHQVRAEAVAGISEAELAQFKRICQRICANLDAVNTNGTTSKAVPVAAVAGSVR